MASIVGKKRGNATYYYLVESARVNGQPRIVSQEYLGTAGELAAAMRGGGLGLPARTQHKDFGAAAAAWGMLEDLGAAAIIDQVTGPRRSDAGASVGTYLALAALGRLVAPCSKLAFADWWAGTAAGRFTGIGAAALDHRRFWDAMHAVGLEELEEISHRIALAIVDASGVDCSSVALDMTNFATFIDTGNERAPIAQRGKAKQKRTDLRLAGLGLVVTRDGGIPLTWHAYPGDKPDVTQFPAMIDALAGRHEAICAASGQVTADVTVVFDAGQNPAANFAHLAGTRLHYVGSVPASDCAALTALPASARGVVDEDRFGGLTACDTRRDVYGAGRRAILTHSPELHDKQARGFTGTTLAKAGRKLDELAATLARGKTRRPRAKVEAEIGAILHDTWARRVVTWQLAGERPKDHRLTWAIDQDARAALEEEIFGKHVLITDHDDWPAAEVVAAYRSQSEAEASFRQMKDPRAASFSPMFHWTEHNIRVHVFTCVLALQLAHLIRRRAARAGLHLSVRALLGELAGIGETACSTPVTAAGPGPTACSPTPPQYRTSS
jgi:transposase